MRAKGKGIKKSYKLKKKKESRKHFPEETALRHFKNMNMNLKCLLCTKH